MLYRFLCSLGRPLTWVLFRPRVRGREHVPADAGFVLCANHLSGFDTFALAYALPRRRLRSMGKPQLFRRPLLGSIVRALGAFPARSGDAPDGAVATAAGLAASGEVVLIFPEGARRRPDRVHTPRSGAARIATAAGVPLVPAALRGTEGWRRLQRWEVAFGEPIRLEAGADPQETTARLWEAVSELEATLV
jgi:1-acyl-sn-glycerol-3-phosphate acyltransferase